MSFHKLLLILGFGSLVHVAYSAVQHRTYLRITEQEFNGLPLDMCIQAVASLVLVLYSILHAVGNFKEIRAAVDLQGKSWETLGNLPSFYMFNHRGKAIFGGYSEEYDDEDESE